MWAWIIEAKYTKRNIELPKLMTKRGSSNAWQGTVATANVIKKGMRARLYNGKGIFFLREMLG